MTSSPNHDEHIKNVSVARGRYDKMRQNYLRELHAAIRDALAGGVAPKDLASASELPLEEIIQIRESMPNVSEPDDRITGNASTATREANQHARYGTNYLRTADPAEMLTSMIPQDTDSFDCGDDGGGGLVAPPRIGDPQARRAGHR